MVGYDFFSFLAPFSFGWAGLFFTYPLGVGESDSQHYRVRIWFSLPLVLT